MHAFKTSLRPAPPVTRNDRTLTKMPQCKFPNKLKWFYLVFHFFCSAQSPPAGLDHKMNMKFYYEPYDTSKSGESWKLHEYLILGTKEKHFCLLFYLFSWAFLKLRSPSACPAWQSLQWCPINRNSLTTKPTQIKRVHWPIIKMGQTLITDFCPIHTDRSPTEPLYNALC